MAITTLDGVIAGMRPPEIFTKTTPTMVVGIHNSLLYAAGIPGAGAAPGSALAGDALTSYAGQLPWTNPITGNSYLALFDGGQAALDGSLILYDRLWHNSGITETTTGGQTVNSVAWPARDKNGSADGEGVMIALEASAACGNAANPATTITYTNSAGTGSRTGTLPRYPISAPAGTFVPFNLQAGDTGVRSVQTLTLTSSYGGGQLHLVAFRELARIHLGVYRGDRLDAVSGGFPRLYDNTVPCLLWMPSATTALVVKGAFGVTQG